MLVITRKAGERIMIGDDIELVVVNVSGSKVRIGIAAPKDVAVLRDDAKGLRKPDRSETVVDRGEAKCTSN